MPDWTYQPFFKPVLFRLPADSARRLTMRALAFQARTGAGRRVFRWMGHVHPPAAARVEALGLCSGGLAVLFSLWCGARPGARSLWWALFLSGTIGFASAIGIHPVVGYTSFVHLLPAYVGALSFFIGIRLLHAPLCRPRGGETDAFPDL